MPSIIKKVLITAATAPEITPFLGYLNTHLIKVADLQYQKDNLSITVLITGIGQVATAYALGAAFSGNQYDWVINIGIAGSYRRSRDIGTVVQVTAEQFAYFGAEMADGNFSDVFEMGLLDNNHPPFLQKKLINPIENHLKGIPRVSGLTTDSVHGFPPSIRQVEERYQPDIETMEGAAFFYACLLREVKFLQLRAISNYVEPRNKDNWNIPLAIKNVNQQLIEVMFPNQEVGDL